MSENSLSSGAAARSSQTGLDDVDLFSDALDRLQDDGGPASDASLVVEERPRLTLVRPEDHDEAASEKATTPSDVADSPDDDDPLLDPDEYGELWLDSAQCATATDNLSSAEPPEEMPAVSEAFELETDIGDLSDVADEFFGHDLSAVDDVILSNPLAEAEAINALLDAPTLEEAGMEPASASPVASESVSIPNEAMGLTKAPPERIGSGKLAPAKLNWKPGDPFGCIEEDAVRFRWELMLTTACVTAVCGLGCIWLLRTILA